MENIFICSLIIMGFVLLLQGGIAYKVLELAATSTKAASAWKRFAQEVFSLLQAKEGLTAVLEGKDIVLEHPDPAEQAEANRLMTDLKRLAQKLKNSPNAKGSGESN